MRENTAISTPSTQNLLHFPAILLLASAGFPADASQPELTEKARAVIETATEKDSLDNGYFVILSNDTESGAQQENVVCPTVDIQEDNVSE